MIAAVLASLAIGGVAVATPSVLASSAWRSVRVSRSAAPFGRSATSRSGPLKPSPTPPARASSDRRVGASTSAGRRGGNEGVDKGILWGCALQEKKQKKQK